MSRDHCIIILFLLCSSCAGIQRNALNERLNNLSERFDHHVGLSIYDVEEEKLIYSFNGNKYFTPASNTKIFTFYTCLNILKDSLVTFYFKESADSLILWPAGDPTFLHPDFPLGESFGFLKNSEKDIYLSFSHASIDPFGSGWAWDDYPYTFSAERSALPLYGNYITIFSDSASLAISNAYFKNKITLADSAENPVFIRDFNSNTIVYQPGRNTRIDTFNIPFKSSPFLSTRLLADTLNKPVYIIDRKFDSTAMALKSLPLDTAYKMMMQDSDNLVAEQLLLQCAVAVSDSMDIGLAINYAEQNLFNFLNDAPKWVDGSGLSRYNLATPNSLISVWKKILEDHGRAKIFPLLATGGVSGTLKNYYKAENPYIFGKTGTLSNNHNLSGYLVTRKGKIFIFSFMNNNYPASSLPVKKQMEEILWEIHLNN